METVLITGTTSGIGKAFAEKFAVMGNNLVLVSRDRQKLEQQQNYLQNQYHVIVNIIAYDLSKEDAADFIMEQLDHRKISVDYLINNAGFNECGMFSETDIRKELEMIDLHIRLITQLTKRILPSMEQRNRGHIVNIGSTGSFIPSPSDAVYSATKAYIASFTNALYGEYKHTGIKISLLCPGAAQTEFARKSKIDQTLLFKIAVMKPEQVVQTAYPKIIKGKRLIIPGIYNKLLIFCTKIMPVTITNRLTLLMLKK